MCVCVCVCVQDVSCVLKLFSVSFAQPRNFLCRLFSRLFGHSRPKRVNSNYNSHSYTSLQVSR